MRPSREGIALFGTVGAAFAASAVALEPYRPYLLGLTAALLAAAFYQTYGRLARQCGPAEAYPPEPGGCAPGGQTPPVFALSSLTGAGDARKPAVPTTPISFPGVI